MALTLHRDDTRRTARTALEVASGPAGVLTASLLLSAGFLLALSDLVDRLG